MRILAHVFVVLASAALVFCASARASLAAGSCGAPIEIGFTFTHYRIVDEPGRLCGGPGHKPNVSRQDNVIVNESDPAVQSIVATKLSAMAEQGAKALRIMIWYAENVTSSSDKLGEVALGQEKSEAEAAAATAKVIGDAQRRGYNQFIVGFGPIGAADPKCRRHEWGDCFEPSTLPNSARFAARVISVVAARDPNANVAYELGVEMCPLPHPQAPAGFNEARYIETMVRANPDRRFVVSCNAASASDLRERLFALEAIYAKMRVRPYAVDIHIYNPSSTEDEAMLAAGEHSALRLHAPLIVGETAVGQKPLLDAILRMRRLGGLTSLKAVLFWPVRFGSHCAFDANIPFDVSNWTSALACRTAN